MWIDRCGPPDISILVCTWNRARDLRDLLGTAVTQDTGGRFEYEIILVDNNSADDTPAVAREFGRADARVRYCFEPRSGRSNALNHGLAVMRAPLYTLADDDTLLEPDHLARVLSVFERNSGATWVGGRVLPVWEHSPPAWVDERHWSALALCDYGDDELTVTGGRPLTLLAASFCRDHVRAARGYHEALGVGPKRMGGTEDVDLFARLWRSGRHGVYSPTIRIHHKVPAARLRKAYHRRWHVGHGRTFAVMWDPTAERSERRVLNVPGHIVRSLVEETLVFLASHILFLQKRAFVHETRIRFALGFIVERLSQQLRPMMVRIHRRFQAAAPPQPQRAVGGVQRQRGIGDDSLRQ